MPKIANDWQTVIGKQAVDFRIDCEGAANAYSAMLAAAPATPTEEP